MSGCHPLSSVVTLEEALRWGAHLLDGEGFENPQGEAAALLSGLRGKPPAWLYIDSKETLHDAERTRYLDGIARRARGEPIPYILGSVVFCGREFAVDARALIPRPETEFLVDIAGEWLRRPGRMPRRVLDVGTGSGAVALSIALTHQRTDVVATDISAAALELARENAARFKGCDVRFLEGDLFAPLPASGGDFDIILSNPPYVSTRDVERTPEIAFEPRLSLDGGPDGLVVVRRLIDEAPRHFAPQGGMLALEVGFDQAAAVCALLRSRGFSITAMVKDAHGYDRVIVGESHGPV